MSENDHKDTGKQSDGGLEFCSPFDNPEVKFKAATDCAYSGDIRKAEKLFLEIIEANSQHYPARIGLGTLYLQENRIDDAVSQLEAATKINPDHPSAFVNLAAAFIQKGDFDAAVNECEEALFIDPKHTPAYKNLSWAYLEKGEYQRCVFVAKKLLELEPESGLAHNNIAVAYFYEKEYDKSLSHVRQAMDKGYPVHPEFFRDLNAKAGQGGGASSG